MRVDFDTLLRGYPIDGETCEIAGYGPTSVGAIRDLLATGDAFLAAVITKGHAVAGVARLGGHPTGLCPHDHNLKTPPMVTHRRHRPTTIRPPKRPPPPQPHATTRPTNRTRRLIAA